MPPQAATRHLVVDSSAIAALLFGEADAASIAARISGAQLAAPQWLDVELANVCVKKMRSRPSDTTLLIEAYEDRALLDITLHPIDKIAVLHVAHANRLSYYGACYLWLARHLDTPLLTLDARLAAAAQS